MKFLKLLPFALLLSLNSIFFDQPRILASVDIVVIITTKTPNGTVNIRKGPGIQYPIVVTVPNGFIARTCGNNCDDESVKDKDGHWWTQVHWNGYKSSGWVRSDYVKDKMCGEHRVCM